MKVQAFKWRSGEEWSYSNWAEGEPGDSMMLFMMMMMRRRRRRRRRKRRRRRRKRERRKRRQKIVMVLAMMITRCQGYDDDPFSNQSST